MYQAMSPAELRTVTQSPVLVRGSNDAQLVGVELARRVQGGREGRSGCTHDNTA